MSSTTVIRPASGSRSLELGSAENHLLIREQLERLIESHLFRNSKRYPNLLRYVVERTLAGKSFELKERTLGVEVFGRPPEYDSNADPVVRVSAAETRKRIAQYYHEAEHTAELRIELPLGSYVPEFRWPEVNIRLATLAPVLIESPKAAPAVIGKRTPRPAVIVAVIALAAAATVATRLLWPHPTVLDQFWRPVLSEPGPVTLFVGKNPGVPGAPPTETAGGGIAWADVKALVRLSVLVQSRNRPYQVRREDKASFAELQQGAAVLIGAFNNGWTMRLSDGGRYGFERDGLHNWIVDHRDRDTRKWGIDLSVKDDRGHPVLQADYALITRVLNQTTGKMSITAAGLWGYGTETAGQFLSEPKFLERLTDHAPPDWQTKSLQVVLRTEVIEGNSGPPQVIATWFW